MFHGISFKRKFVLTNTVARSLRYKEVSFIIDKVIQSYHSRLNKFARRRLHTFSKVDTSILFPIITSPKVISTVAQIEFQISFIRVLQDYYKHGLIMLQGSYNLQRN